VKEDSGLSKRKLVSRDLVSDGTIGTMRAKWREMKGAGDDSLLQMTWMQALRRAPGGSAEWKEDEWRERKVQELIERLVAAGIAKEFSKHPDIVAEAWLARSFRSGRANFGNSCACGAREASVGNSRNRLGWPGPPCILCGKNDDFQPGCTVTLCYWHVVHTGSGCF
jgi:hypothetical protein